MGGCMFTIQFWLQKCGLHLTVVLNSSGLDGIFLNQSEFHLSISGSLGLKCCAKQLVEYKSIANKCNTGKSHGRRLISSSCLSSGKVTSLNVQ